MIGSWLLRRRARRSARRVEEERARILGERGGSLEEADRRALREWERAERRRASGGADG